MIIWKLCVTSGVSHTGPTCHGFFGTSINIIWLALKWSFNFPCQHVHKHDKEMEMKCDRLVATSIMLSLKAHLTLSGWAIASLGMTQNGKCTYCCIVHVTRWWVMRRHLFPLYILLWLCSSGDILSAWIHRSPSQSVCYKHEVLLDRSLF